MSVAAAKEGRQGGASYLSTPTPKPNHNLVRRRGKGVAEGQCAPDTVRLQDGGRACADTQTGAHVYQCSKVHRLEMQ